jgi:hypothetical protein
MDIAGAYLVTSLVVLGLIVYVIILIFVSIAIANAARNKGQSWALFFWLSFLVNWFIMLIVMLIIKKDPNQTSFVSGDLGSTPVTCEFCKEQIRADAVVCKHCGRDVTPQLPRLVEEESERVQAALEAERKLVLQSEQEEIERKNKHQLAEEQRKARFDALFRSKKFYISIAAFGLVIAGFLSYFAIQEQMRIASLNDWESRFLDCQELLPPSVSYEIGVDNQSATIFYDSVSGLETREWLRCIGEELLGVVASESFAAVIVRPALSFDPSLREEKLDELIIQRFEIEKRIEITKNNR